MSVQCLVKPTVRTALNKRRRARRKRLSANDGTSSAFRLTFTALFAITMFSAHSEACLEYWTVALLVLCACLAANLRKLNGTQTDTVKFPLFWKAPNHTQLFFARVQHGFFRNRAEKAYPGFPYFRTRLQLEPFETGFVWVVDDSPGDTPIAEDREGFRPVEFVFKRVS